MENEIEVKDKKFLSINAHADDADFSAAGTMLKWISKGAKGAIVIATNGDKGSSDKTLSSEELKKIRKEEQLKASSMLGLEKTWFLDYPDAHLEVNQSLKESLVKIIREYQPDIILTWDPTVFYSKKGMINHTDHRAIGEATLDAAYPLARDFLTFPESGYEPFKVKELFLYNSEEPNYFSDISFFIEAKTKILRCHESQCSEDFVLAMQNLGKENGAKIGKDFAESFVHLTLPD